MFQGGEEILEGAKDMLSSGVLANPDVDCGAMIHVIVGANLDTGTLVFGNSRICAHSSDFFKISLCGKSAHGAMPKSGVDSIAPALEIATLIQNDISREAESKDALITIGEFHAGSAPNIIAEKAVITGSIRAFEDSARELIKSRISEVVEACAKQHKASGKLEFTNSCPTLINSTSALECGIESAKLAYSHLGKSQPPVLTAEDLKGRSYASEDFSYISQRIPSVMAAICAGNGENGLHHPAVLFDEAALPYGAAAYAGFALCRE
jgi:amidohydrolase